MDEFCSSTQRNEFTTFITPLNIRDEINNFQKLFGGRVNSLDLDPSLYNITKPEENIIKKQEDLLKKFNDNLRKMKN